MRCFYDVRRRSGQTDYKLSAVEVQAHGEGEACAAGAAMVFCKKALAAARGCTLQQCPKLQLPLSLRLGRAAALQSELPCSSFPWSFHSISLKGLFKVLLRAPLKGPLRAPH